MKCITKERFLYLKENIAILDRILHIKEDTVVTDDKDLTKEILILKNSIRRFEKNTGLNIEIK